MGKTISIWVSDEEHQMIKELSGGNISNYLKRLLMQLVNHEYEQTEKEALSLKILIEKIGRILEKLEGQHG